MTPDPAVLADRTTSPTVVPPNPSWIALKISRTSVGMARRFAADAIDGHVTDPDHADNIVLIVSELVTNARNATARLRVWEPRALPLRFGIRATDRWTYMYVQDPDHRPLPASDKGGQLAENGRGLGIVDHLADARWVTYAEHSKTVHVVVAAPGVTLMAAELKQIGAPA